MYIGSLLLTYVGLLVSGVEEVSHWSSGPDTNIVPSVSFLHDAAIFLCMHFSYTPVINPDMN
jgi:hypothetical protein